MPFPSALEIGDILTPISSIFMPVLILDKGHFLFFYCIRGVIILLRLSVVEESHAIIHVGGIVVSTHGVVVGELILENSVSTMVITTEHHHY